jgi:PST family polysaccharide transporter/lipopolysaccharide exporter
MQKELKFKSIAIIDIVGIVTGLVVTLGLAHNGYQEMSFDISASYLPIPLKLYWN